MAWSKFCFYLGNVNRNETETFVSETSALQLLSWKSYLSRLCMQQNDASAQAAIYGTRMCDMHAL